MERLIPGQNIYRAFKAEGQDGSIQAGWQNDAKVVFIDSVSRRKVFRDKDAQQPIEGDIELLEGEHYIDFMLYNGACSGIYFVPYTERLLHQTLSVREPYKK